MNSLAKKLSYEEWLMQCNVKVPDGLREQLRAFHDIDVEAEIENVLRQEYDWYLNYGD